MNGLAQVGSWQVSSELSAHCASQPQVCEDLSASVGRALMSGLLIHGALIGGAELAVVPQIFVRMWTLASSKLPQILARTPTTALTCFATLLASGSSLVTAQHTESAIANMLDELGTALATLCASANARLRPARTPVRVIPQLTARCVARPHSAYLISRMNYVMASVTETADQMG